jgi:hypothetical protein
MADMASDHDIITVPIGEFRRLSGLGQTKVYELIGLPDDDPDKIESILVGKRRLIVLDSWRRYIERHRSTPANTPPRHRPPPRQSRVVPARPGDTPADDRAARRGRRDRRGRVASGAPDPA